MRPNILDGTLDLGLVWFEILLITSRQDSACGSLSAAERRQPDCSGVAVSNFETQRLLPSPSARTGLRSDVVSNKVSA